MRASFTQVLAQQRTLHTMSRVQTDVLNTHALCPGGASSEHAIFLTDLCVRSRLLELAVRNGIHLGGTRKTATCVCARACTIVEQKCNVNH